MNIDVIAFAREVREVVAAIPTGMVSTYGDVAALAGAPSHARLVGRILAGIGMDSEVPCHRVVNVKGACAPHWHAQGAMLRAEGITFTPAGYVDMTRHRWQPLSAESS